MDRCEKGERALSNGENCAADGQWKLAMEWARKAQEAFYENEDLGQAGAAVVLEAYARKWQDLNQAAFVFEDEDGEPAEVGDIPEELFVALTNGIAVRSQDIQGAGAFERLLDMASELKAMIEEVLGATHRTSHYIEELIEQLTTLSQADHGMVDPVLSKTLSAALQEVIPQGLVNNFELRRLKNGEIFFALDWMRDPSAEEARQVERCLAQFSAQAEGDGDEPKS
jgi:hypothetical protein